MPIKKIRARELKKLCEKRPTCFQTLTFRRNQVFQNTGICSWIFQEFPTHGFPTPWILDFRGGRASGRQKPREDWTPCCGKTEVYRKMLREFMFPGLHFLSHRIVESLKCMIFDILGKSLHRQMILGPPDGSLDFL